MPPPRTTLNEARQLLERARTHTRDERGNAGLNFGNPDLTDVALVADFARLHLTQTPGAPRVLASSLVNPIFYWTRGKRLVSADAIQAALVGLGYRFYFTDTADGLDMRVNVSRERLARARKRFERIINLRPAADTDLDVTTLFSRPDTGGGEPRPASIKCPVCASRLVQIESSATDGLTLRVLCAENGCQTHLIFSAEENGETRYRLVYEGREGGAR